MFNNIKLQFSDNVSHLGHLLSYNLNDEMDITRVIKDLTVFFAPSSFWIHLLRLISSKVTIFLSMVVFYGHCPLYH